MKAANRRTFKARDPSSGGGTAALLALDAALNAIDVPAIVVDLDGRVLHANASAQTLLSRDPSTVARSLALAVAGAPAGLAWNLTLLRGTEKRHGFLAILRRAGGEVSVSDSVRAASTRWRLTARQAEVLELVARGYSNALIAESLGIGEGTVEFHLSAIFDKAGVDSRAMLFARMLQP